MEVQATVLVQGQGDTFTDADHVVDGAANRFVAYGEQLGNETWCSIKRYAPNGTVTGAWTAFPSANHKIDELTLAHSGDVLLVLLTTHEIVSNKPRSIRVESAAIAGVYSVRPGQELEEGGAGAFTGNGEPQPQEGGVTKAEVEEVVRAVLGLATGSLVQAISGSPTGQIRQGIEDKVKDALLELFDKENVPGNETEKRFRDVFWAVIDQRCYYALGEYFKNNPTPESAQDMADDILTEQEHSLEPPQ